jgi:protein-S-isoprenylcysteine O-methyltransferase Ste14
MSTTPDRPGIIVPPPVIFLVGYLGGLALDRLVALPRLAAPWPVALTLALLGALVGGWGAATFAHHRTGIFPHQSATAVVTRGPYAWSRNPMYLGITLGYAGLALLFGHTAALLMLPLALLVLHQHVIVREEQYLTAKFGQHYLAYRSRVRRWL